MVKNDLYVSPNGEIITIQKISKKNGITIEFENGETYQISPLNFKANFIRIRKNKSVPQMENQNELSKLESELFNQLNTLSEFTKKYATGNGKINTFYQNDIINTEAEIKRLRAKIAKLKNNQSKQSNLFTLNNAFQC